MPAERKYVLTRVAKGDYVFPSNDAATIWRVHTYEDGPSHGLDWPRDRTLWALRRWWITVDATSRSYVEVDDWDRWVIVQDGFERRADAIEAALNA